MAAMITGKTIVVTGGSRGIGLGLVKRFLQRDNTVVATTRKPAEAEALHQLAQQPGKGKLLIKLLDTSCEASVTAWAAALATEVSHVDVLVNNAGAYGRRLPLSELTAEDMLYAFKVNALGPFLCVQQLCNRGLLGSVPSTGSPSPPPAAAAPATPEQLPLRSPSTTSLIVNISSIVASHGDTTVSATSPSGYAYRASKAALNIMSKSFTIDLGKSGVRSVLIHPGYVQTDLTGGAGWVSVEQSTDGIMAVLEGAEPLDGRFLSYTGEQIPW
ncbi:MAG: hypothetical protein WDW36_000710 [Sanguina aurantia]